MQIFTGMSNLSVFFVLALSSEMSLCPVVKPQLHLVSIRGSFQEELRGAACTNFVFSLRAVFN